MRDFEITHNFKWNSNGTVYKQGVFIDDKTFEYLSDCIRAEIATGYIKWKDYSGSLEYAKLHLEPLSLDKTNICFLNQTQTRYIENKLGIKFADGVNVYIQIYRVEVIENELGERVILTYKDRYPSYHIGISAKFENLNEKCTKYWEDDKRITSTWLMVAMEFKKTLDPMEEVMKRVLIYELKKHKKEI